MKFEGIIVLTILFAIVFLNIIFQTNRMNILSSEIDIASERITSGVDYQATLNGYIDKVITIQERSVDTMRSMTTNYQSLFELISNHIKDTSIHQKANSYPGWGIDPMPYYGQPFTNWWFGTNGTFYFGTNNCYTITNGIGLPSYQYQNNLILL